MCVCVCVCVRVCMCLRACVRACMLMYACACVRACVYIDMCLPASVRACLCACVRIYIYIYLNELRISISFQVKLATLIQDDPKAHFSIATTLRYREDATPFPGLLYFTLDPYLVMLSVKQGVMKYHFFSLCYVSTWDWTPISRTIGEHSTHWPNTLVWQLLKKGPSDHLRQWSLILVSFISFQC